MVDDGFTYVWKWVSNTNFLLNYKPVQKQML